MCGVVGIVGKGPVKILAAGAEIPSIQTLLAREKPRLLLIVMGNVLPRARPNWMFGIRTPWTLSNDRVWERTHRVGGYLMLGAGVVILAAAVVAPGPVSVFLFLGAVTVSVAGSILYSYLAWRQETRS